MNPLIVIGGAATALSYILPWASQPGIGALSPQEALRPVVQALFDQPSLETLQSIPAVVLAFLLSFVLAGLVALLSLFGATSRLLAVIAGLLPFGIAGYLWFSARDQLAALGLPLPDAGDLSGLGDAVMQVADVGLYAWAGGALALLLAALFPRQS